MGRQLRRCARICAPINRRKWHLAGVTALVCVLAGLILAQLTPEYRATALVMLDTRKTKVTNTPDVIGGLTLDIPAMQTEIEVLRSVSLLGRVVDKLRLDQDPEYGAEPISTLGLAVKEVRSIYNRWIGLDADKERATEAIDNTPRAHAIASLELRLRVATRSRSYVIAGLLNRNGLLTGRGNTKSSDQRWFGPMRATSAGRGRGDSQDGQRQARTAADPPQRGPSSPARRPARVTTSSGKTLRARKVRRTQ